jgi:pimeloyl-ACP methyl ester carboxylesterase
VDFWETYDRITCPVLVLHGLQSDLLLAATAQEMTQRGPKARLVDIPNVGHAPALMDAAQIGVVRNFLSGSGAPALALNKAGPLQAEPQ